MRYPNRQQLIFFFCCVLLASIIYSPYLLSVSMFMLSGLCLFCVQDGRLAFDREGISRMFHIYRYPVFTAVTLFFFVVFLSFWQTEDSVYWLERLRIKVPFLVFPLVFLALPRFTARQIDGLFYALLLMLTLTSIGIGVNYLLHADAINAQMLTGKPMPTPRNHIRLSLLMAVGIIGGAWLYRKRFYWRYPGERKLIGFCTIFLFVFIHVLAVRSGLLTLYAAIVVLLIRHILKTQYYKPALAVLLALFLLPIGAYFAFPSLQSKLDYMRYDLMMYSSNGGAYYADSGRITSLKVGWDIWERYPVFGAGAGNLKREVQQEFDAHYPGFEQALMPHNQFLFVAAGTGVVGLVLFLYAFFYPLFYRKNYRNDLLLAFYTISFTAFLIEHTIENSLGVGFFVFFLTLFLNHLNLEGMNSAP
ncbi:MAG: O-antigen ligase family protein [Lewinellaceae bacterium]|nr:O-antigen ligase family protein [Saprospiraceae bacterium]MCB9331462.1 O-antigen ligase family protein [Lewinellaceae bacterium]